MGLYSPEKPWLVCHFKLSYHSPILNWGQYVTLKFQPDCLFEDTTSAQLFKVTFLKLQTGLCFEILTVVD